MINTSYYHSPIGKILLASKDGKLIGAWIEGQKYYLGQLKEEIKEKEDEEILKKTRRWLSQYFKGENPSITDLELAPIGSEFRQMVWKLLCEIPYGQVTTYGTLAKKLAQKMKIEKMSAQAVGGAVGHNPISIIIPCHRVIGARGSLTGYAGGIDKKQKLLQHENGNFRDGSKNFRYVENF